MKILISLLARYPSLLMASGFLALSALNVLQYHGNQSLKKSLHAAEIHEKSLGDRIDHYVAAEKSSQLVREKLYKRLTTLQVELDSQKTLDRQAISAVLHEDVPDDPVQSLEWLSQRAGALQFGEKP